MGVRGEVFSTRCSSAGDRRTYFFNVKENRNGDLFLNIVESKKQPESEFARHQVVIFQEDVDAFMRELSKATGFISEYSRDRGKNSRGE